MNITLMKNLASMTEQKLFNYLRKYLFGKYGKSKIITDPNDEWMIAIGDTPIMLCAHLDTVFDNPPINIFVDWQAEVMWAPAGLGADDRAGVYAILSLLMEGFKPSVLFTTGEEVGCQGAIKLINSMPDCPVSDIKCLIQLDRRNNGESVYYACQNKTFENWINKYGFYTQQGTFTDISVVCPYWGLAGVNLSVGYYNEHTKQEFLRYNELEQTIEKIRQMLIDINDVKDPFIYIKNSNAISWLDKAFINCDFCGSPLTKQYYKIQDGGFTYNLCPDCIKFYDSIPLKSQSPQEDDDFHIIPPI